MVWASLVSKEWRSLQPLLNSSNAFYSCHVKFQLQTVETHIVSTSFAGLSLGWDGLTSHSFASQLTIYPFSRFTESSSPRCNYTRTNLAQLKEQASHSLRQSDDELIPVNNSCQGRYSSRKIENHSNLKKFKPFTIAGCFSRNDPDHLLKDCDKPLNISRASKRKLEYLTKRKTSNANLLILFLLCYRLDDDGLKNISLESNDDDVKIFNNLLVILSQDNEPDI